MRCRRCGEENQPQARFCSACGAQLATDDRQERKVVSILFIDLVGHTPRSERSDPEEVRDLLVSYHEIAAGVIASFGGNLEKFIGDAVMAVFGAPISHGDDAERAVRAGLQVLTAVDDLGVKARGAVNSGEAVVAVGAAATSGQALAMGDVVNTASRLQSSAPPGGLVVGEETYRLTRNTINYEPLGAIDAKGKDEPVRLWRAVSTAAVAPERAKAPMVGRDREMQLLSSIWDRAVEDRRPHLVTVLGPPGIGKSRLQREFSAYASNHGGAVARGRCLPYGNRPAYAAFAQLIGARAGIYENDSVETAKAKLAAMIRDVLPAAETEDATLYLSVLLGLREAESQRSFLFFAGRRMLEELAAQQPLLVVFEDLHWADSGLLDLIEYLASHIRDTPLVIVGLARPEFIDLRRAWGSGVHAHSTIALDPLSKADALKLATDLLVQAAAQAEAVDRLAQTAEGNPLFIEELASSFAENAESGPALPTTIREAIASRLDGLPTSAREVLLDASVVGRTFWRGVIQAIGTHPDLDNDLALLEARDFIRRVPTTRVRGDIEYLVKHILIHEVAYGTLPRATRRQRHRLVAEYIESAVQDRAQLSTVLAHHWREAGEADRAIEYLMQAAQQALNAWALSDAVAIYDSALSLATDDGERNRIRLARGLGRSKLGAYPEAAEDLNELLPHLTGMDRIEGLVGYAWAQEWSERGDETILAAEEALRLAEAAEDKELIPVAKALLSQGLSMRGGPGDLDGAGELSEEALRVWVPGTRSFWHSNAQHLYAEQLYWTGRLSDAIALMTKALQSESDPQSIQARLRSASLRAQALCSIGEYEESIQLFEATIRLALDLGRPTRIFLNYSTQPLRELFDFEEARRRSEQNLEGPEEAGGFLMPRANARADLIQAALGLGDVGIAERLWQDQWDESQSNRAWTRWLITGRLAAVRTEMEHLAGRFEKAEEWARKTIDMCIASRRFKYEMVGRMLLGRELVAQGKPRDGVREAAIATEQADHYGSPLLRWQTQAELGRASYTAGDDAAAEKAFATASAIIEDMASRLAPDRRSRFLAAEPVRDVLQGATRTA